MVALTPSKALSASRSDSGSVSVARCITPSTPVEVKEGENPQDLGDHKPMSAVSNAPGMAKSGTTMNSKLPCPKRACRCSTKVAALPASRPMPRTLKPFWSSSSTSTLVRVRDRRASTKPIDARANESYHTYRSHSAEFTARAAGHTSDQNECTFVEACEDHVCSLERSLVRSGFLYWLNLLTGHRIPNGGHGTRSATQNIDRTNR